MSDAASGQAIRFPAIGFSTDEAMAFDEMIQLLAAAATLERQGRHIGMEVVDTTERRWRVTGLYRPEPKKRPWWMFWPSLTVPQIEEQVDLDEIAPQSFTVTRDRVRSIWGRWLNSADDKLPALLAAPSMAELAKLCSDLEPRQNARRILTGDGPAQIRDATDVARRAVVLLAMIGVAGGEPRTEITSWLDKSHLLDVLAGEERLLLTAFRPPQEMLIEAGWEAEALVMLLWSLDLLDTPPIDRNWDVNLFADRLPPSSGEAVEDFLTARRLRPATDLAGMTDQLWKQAMDSSQALTDDASSEQRTAHKTTWRRFLAMHWILNPERSWD